MRSRVNFRELFKVGHQISNLEISLPLPIDDDGDDIFRSKNINWKKENNFNFFFKKAIDVLLHLCNQAPHKIANEINFEFSDIIFPDSVELYSLIIPKAFDLDNCVFEGEVKFIDCQFKRGLTLSNSTFKKIVSFRNCKVRDLICTKGIFGETLRMYECDFENEITFFRSDFRKYIICEKVSFEGTLDFSECKINTSLQKGFSEFFDVIFYDAAFEKTEFYCGLAFNNITIKANTEFIDTLFSINQDVDFNKIILDNGTLVFKSTDESKKLFGYTTRFAIREQNINGKITFENVDFNKLNQNDKENFIRLSKNSNEKVVIGKGCLKYRHYTDNITIQSNSLTQRLIEDMANTFINFFVKHNRYNLGFEIVEQTSEKITYFYFSDENITNQEFLDYLKYTEEDMWRIVKNEPVETRTNIIQHSIDNNYLSQNFLRADLTTLFYKLGVSLAFQDISKADIVNVLNITHFNESWETIAPEEFVSLLEHRFTPQILIQQFNNPQFTMQQQIQTLNNYGKMINADAVTIIESSSLLTKDDENLIKFIQQSSESDTKKGELIEAIEIIKDDKMPEEKKSQAKDLWKKFLESGVGEVAKEVVKGLASPTFWALLVS